MNVLQISKFYPPVLGGIESVTWELVEGLHRHGVHADVLCANQALRTLREREPWGYEVTRAGSLGMLLSTSMSPAMPWLLRQLQQRYDVVHVHMPDPMAALAVWVARPQGRLVVHWHSDVIRQRLALKLYGPLQDWLLARADAIIATSRPYAEASEPLAPWRHKVTVIPIGISDNHHQVSPELVSAIRQRYRGRRLVFALGRMAYYKGFDVLIEAAAALSPECAVLIGGHGELLDYYRDLVVRRGLAGKVHLLGHILDHELPSYFDACDVFCMPSTVRAEAYGVAMLEAMVMGKPIVASNIVGSGVPWVNRHGVTGLNVPVRDAGALADALGRLLGDDVLRARMGEASRARYDEEFCAMQMTRRTMALYGCVTRLGEVSDSVVSA